MNHLVSACAARPADDPIFAISHEAERRRRAGESILNASLGALMDDAGRLAVLPTVVEALRAVDPVRAASYAPIAGDELFRRAVVQDVFGGGRLADCAVAVATAGGTGALHHAIHDFLDPGQSLVTTSYYWGPYRTIADHARRLVRTFPMFGRDGRFDVGALERSLVETLREQGRALVVLNTPCHNPTGYSLDAAEWRELVAVLARAGRRAPVTLVVDLAYARYGGPGSEAWVEEVAPLVESCNLLVAWSASKAFTQYGARVGALIAVVPDAAQRERVANALSYSCRATWSNCNHLGLLAVANLLVDPALRRRVDLERAQLKELLDERVALFNREARRVGLRTPRYEGGFFVAVFTDAAEAAAAAARAEGVFVVPMEGALRVALCSTPREGVPRLVEVLERAIVGAGARS